MLLSPQLAALLSDGASVVLCALAVATDLRSQRIPNRLSMVGVLLGLALATLTGSLAFALSALAGLACGLGVLLVGRALGAVGMGDVKLMAAVGALVHVPLVVSALVYTLLWGGLLALGYALARGALGAALRNVGALVRRRQAPAPLHAIPYALAIFAGTAHAVGSRYVAALGLW